MKIMLRKMITSLNINCELDVSKKNLYCEKQTKFLIFEINQKTHQINEKVLSSFKTNYLKKFIRMKEVASNVDASAVSASRSSIASMGTRKQIYLGTFAWTDSIFPLADYLLQMTSIPTLIVVVFSLFTYLQSIITSLWPAISFWSGGTSSVHSAFNTIIQVFWFLSIDDMDSHLDPMLIGLIVVFVLTIFSFIFQFVYYAFNHRFTKWSLYITRFFCQYVTMIMVHPYAAFTAGSLQLLTHEATGRNWAFMIIGVIMMVVNILIFMVVVFLSSSSTMFDVNIVSAFDPWLLFLAFLTNSCTIILNFLFTIFPTWTTVIIQVLHIILNVYLLVNLCLSLPFHHISGNIIFFAFSMASALLDIVMIIMLFLNKDAQMAALILIPVFLIIGFIVSIIVIKLQYNAIKSIADYSDEEEKKAESETTEIFENAHLTHNESRALSFLRVSFTQNYKCFCDFSLTKFIATNYQSNKILCTFIQILSCFPGENRQLNTFFNITSGKSDLTMFQRFLLYQVYRLKTLRQSSTSSGANERLLRLKNLTEQCVSDVVGFWVAKDPDISYFEVLAKEEKKLQALWLEAIRDYPNSPKYCEEYIRFLSECTTNFQRAIIMKERADYIDMGRSFSVDSTFKAFVRCFPNYVKKDIIDLKGNFKAKAVKQSGSASQGGQTSQSIDQTSSSSLDLSVTCDKEIDAEIEAKISRSLFSYSKMRLSLFHALKNKSHASVTIMPFISTIVCLIGFAAFIAFFFYIKSTYLERAESLTYLNLIAQARFYLGISSFSLYFKYMNGVDRLGDIDSTLIGSIENDRRDLYFHEYIPFNGTSFDYTVLSNSLTSRTIFNTLLGDVADLSMSGTEIYSLASQLVNRESNLTICSSGEALSPISMNLKSIYVFIYYLQQDLATETNYSAWYQSDEYCQLINNWRNALEGSSSLFSSFLEYQIRRGEELSASAKIIMIAVMIALFIISFVPIVALALWFVQATNKIAKALHALDRDAKMESTKPIRKMDEDTSLTPNEPKVGITKMVPLSGVVFIVSLVEAILFLFMIKSAEDSSTNIDQLNRWEYYASNLLASVLEGSHQTLQVLALSHSESSFTDRASEYLKAIQSFDTVTEANNGLVKGTDTSAPCEGYDDQLDFYILKESCSVDSQSQELHDTYRCGSISQLIASFDSIGKNILSNRDEYSEIKDNRTYHFVHLVNNHLWYHIMQVVTRLEELAQTEYDSMISGSLVFMVFGLILAVINLVIGLIIRNYMQSTYDAALSEVKRVPPMILIQSKEIKSILLNKDEAVASTSVSVSRNILHKSGDALLCTSISGVIEIVNPSMSETLGYTPEQLLGQPSSMLFNSDCGEKITKEMGMMKEGQRSDIFEDHLICVSDNGNEVPCFTTILGMKNGGQIESFVIIIRDETALLEQQENAEKAKAQSENLLFQILPRDIVIKLNQGEKDISFTVPSATIIFIDIVKFSEYSASLTPQDIMGNLSLIFASFDKLIKKYNLITKIKLIGDVYMAAAGLFSPDAQPQEHATQVIKFGLDALAELDDNNVKLNANLQIRIGVNTGGPILAGVLGTDKPVFDIIGDPINVAARLQSTDIPGRIQIPQSTYDLLSGLEFNMEPRGEVFLKGKGKVNTFFVNPGISFASFELSNANELGKSDTPGGINYSLSSQQMLPGT